MRRQKGLVLTAIVLGLLLAGKSVEADVFMKHKHHTDGMKVMGQAQPPRDSVKTEWVATEKMRMDDGDTSTIVRLDRRVVYMIHHPDKTYNEMPMDSGRMADMRKAMGKGFSVKVTRTEETRKIGQWNCRKYLREMSMGKMPVKSEVWATEELEFPSELLTTFAALQLGPQQPGRKDLQMLEQEMRKVKGMPVLTVTTSTVMKGVTAKSSMELLEMKYEEAPGNLFEIPEGYTKVEGFPGPDGGPMPPPPSERGTRPPKRQSGQ